MAELIKMLFGMWTRVHKRNYLLDGGTDPPREGALLAEKTSGLFPHATEHGSCTVEQHSDWPTAEAVSHQIFQMKNDRCNAASRQNSVTINVDI